MLTAERARELGHTAAMLTADRAELLLMSAGEDLLVQGLCILVLALFQVAGGLEGQGPEGEQDARSQAFSSPPSPLLPPAPSSPGHQVVLGLGHVGVVRPKACGVDLQCPPVVVFHLLGFALVLAQQGQVAQLLGHVWMKLAQNLGQEREPVAGLGAGLRPPSAQPTWPPH